ncbi:phosphotransferase [Cryobacterium zongtaii]|uniref:Maltokinase n=1 Tax=Cryobacterium zongtaii TaxID=1259217 RepID=A0A2S3ZD25_9MICO|nr:phosphotransferase [Cryobacterium zongtaii]POH64265.1 phosphotransferase [Cryobacterium zongtaii]
MKHASAGTGIDLTPAIDGWVGAQRWFAGKAHSPVLRSIGQWALPTDEAGVRIACHLVLDTASRFSTLYQLPLTERTAPLPESSALIAQTVGRDGLPRYVYDAPHDPVYAAALLRFITSAASLSSDDPGGVTARGELLRAGMGPDDSTPYSVTASRVISGEQSNTSIVLDVADEAGRPGRPVICKVFRVVAAGSNPDVSVQSALAGAGSRFVPEPIGAVSGEWTNPLSAARHSGHLVFAQEFLPGVDDAWRVALAAAAAGDDFSIPAHALGVATAAVHRDLDRVFPTVASTPDVINQLCLTMRERYRLAAREVPELAAHREAIEAVFARAKAAPWPRLQRIHGDYHLGQVLDVPGRGWVLIDFEGEPLRPLAERSLPDIPLRDVAGMLRSFDYVGATIAMRDPAAAPAAIEWAMTARAAFLLGYHAGDGDSQAGTAHAGQEALLAAFELDKAVYESIYEIRNRPTWLPIPLRAVRRLAQDAHAAAHSPG